MPSQHKNPLLGWRPPAEHSAWARAEAERRDVPVGVVLTEALTEYQLSRRENGALLARIRELHHPVRVAWGLACQGCDLGVHAESDPGWPCSTAEIVYTADEVAKLKRVN